LAEYVSFEPQVEVSGDVILSLLEGTQNRMADTLAQYGINDVQAGGWYPKQAMLDALKEFGLMADLVSIGMSIPELAQWPPEIDTIWAAFEVLDEAYHMNHRNGPIGSYQIEKVGDRAVDVIAENPYPCDFDYGLVFALAQRYAPEGARLHVVHDQDAPCRKHGDDSCVYHIKW
jgi:hypothetical protein